MGIVHTYNYIHYYIWEEPDRVKSVIVEFNHIPEDLGDPKRLKSMYRYYHNGEWSATSSLGQHRTIIHAAARHDKKEAIIMIRDH